MAMLRKNGRAFIVKCREAHNNIGKLVQLIEYFPASSPQNQYGCAFWMVAAVGDDYLVTGEGKRVHGGLFAPSHLCPVDTEPRL